MSSPPIRAFIAVELPPQIQTELDGVMKRLRSSGASAVRWVPATNIHLTLKFLGDTPLKKLTDLRGLLRSVAGQHAPVAVTVKGSGAFPNSRNPRVIWVGVETPLQLGALQKAVETAAETIGSPPEERGFSPHLTLGRVQKNASQAEVALISAALVSVKVAELGSFQAASFTLFRSDLRPTGSIYTPLEQFKLSG